MDPTPARPGTTRNRSPTVNVELTRDELSALLVHARMQLAELERADGVLDEEEGESVTKWNVRRTLAPQLDLFRDLALKMEAAAREAGWR